MKFSSAKISSTAIIYEISCVTSLINSSSLFEIDAQDMCQFDLSFATKDHFIIAISKLTFSTIKYSDIAFSKLFMEIYGNVHSSRQDFL